MKKKGEKMKVKGNKFILIIMVISFLFTSIGCSSSAKKDIETKEKDEVAVETKEKDEVAAEIIYLSEVIEYTEDFSACFKGLGNLLSSPNLGDETWNLLVAIELVEMESLIEKTRTVKAPLKYEEAHEALLKAMDYYETIPKYLPKAIDNLDVELLNEIIDNMEMGTLYISLYTEALGEIK